MKSRRYAEDGHGWYAHDGRVEEVLSEERDAQTEAHSGSLSAQWVALGLEGARRERKTVKTVIRHARLGDEEKKQRTREVWPALLWKICG